MQRKRITRDRKKEKEKTNSEREKKRKEKGDEREAEEQQRKGRRIRGYGYISFKSPVDCRLNTVTSLNPLGISPLDTHRWKRVFKSRCIFSVFNGAYFSRAVSYALFHPMPFRVRGARYTVICLCLEKNASILQFWSSLLHICVFRSLLFFAVAIIVYKI